MPGRKHSAFASRQLARFAYERSRRRLRELLGAADPLAFLDASWVLDWQRRDNPYIPFGYDYPPQYVGAKIPEPGRVHSWSLETLLTERFSIGNVASPRIANTKAWGYIAEIVNELNRAENAEGALNRSEFILNEMDRILYRQLPWQNEGREYADYIRWMSIFSNQRLTEIFFERVGTTPNKFVWIGIILAMFKFREAAVVPRINPVGNFVITQDDTDAFLAAVSDTTDNLIVRSRDMVRDSGLQFRDSPFRKTPLVRFNTPSGPQYRCPLMMPLIWRITTGMYYDVVAEPETRNIFGSEFERYQRRLLQAAFPNHRICGDETYGAPHLQRRRPDVLVADGNNLLLAFECKAKRIPLANKIELIPNPSAREELATGIFQLARFRMDLRANVFQDLREVSGSRFIVMTLDEWVLSSTALKADIFSRAQQKLDAANLSPDFDIGEITLCTASELDIMIARLQLNELLEVFRLNALPEKRDHGPYTIALGMFKGAVKWGSFPLASEILPEELMPSDK